MRPLLIPQMRSTMEGAQRLRAGPTARIEQENEPALPVGVERQRRAVQGPSCAFLWSVCWLSGMAK